ncbi:Uma2 family endonuclease [Methylocystis echinoides]|uniref:Uma2 family endonuclease n=1 Tax=Methylocystis echinoides TaxID=29468 RepID=UPI003422E02C
MARLISPRYPSCMSAAALPNTRMSVEEFLAWSQTQAGRYELVGGEVLAQASERAAHAKIKGRVYLALHNAIRAKSLPCYALPDGMAVRIEADTVFEPDAQVYCGAELPSDAIFVESPVVVVEVLSPSTGKNDALRKLAAYFKLPSVAHYLIVSPDSRLVFHHARGQGTTILTKIIRDGLIVLDPPGLEISLSDLYGE